MKHVFGKDASWIRIGHWLLHWKRTPPLFSERNGYITYWPIPLTAYRIRLERTKAMPTKPGAQ